MKRNGFTLIELLVVIAIIGILSAIAMISLSSARQKAKIARAKAELEQIAKAVQIAQTTTNMVISAITKQTWTDQDCVYNRSNPDLRNIPDGDNCAANQESAFESITDATDGLVQTLPHSMLRDPWGSPYMLDENEGTYSGQSGDPCRPDEVRSVGPDGIPSADDIKVSVPFIKCPLCTSGCCGNCPVGWYCGAASC